MRRQVLNVAVSAVLALVLSGCQSFGYLHSPGWYRGKADEAAYGIVEQKQQEGLGRTEPFSIAPSGNSLREKLLREQNLTTAGPASYGSRNLEPIEHWPKDDYLEGTPEAETASPWSGQSPLVLSLQDALEVAAYNNRDYQTRKEAVYLTALALELERDFFRSTFTGSLEAVFTHDRTAIEQEGGRVVEGLEYGGILGFTRRFMNGMVLSGRLGMDLVRLLEPDRRSSRAVFGDASISVPLLRGSGRHIVAEPLTQAEREALYAILEFERFKREFAVSVATSYLNVLQNLDSIENQEENYRNLIASTRRARALVDAGDLPPIQVDQAVQDELRARDRWIAAQQNYLRSLDQFKILLGLPTDAHVELMQEELDRLVQGPRASMIQVDLEEAQAEIPAADAPIDLVPPSDEGAGPHEFDEDYAVSLALQNRLDMAVAQGQVYDAMRNIVVRADALRAEVNLLGSVSVGERRSLGSARSPNGEGLDFDEGFYSALLSIDLPFERTAEMIAYRRSLIDLERAVRNVQALEDQIKFDIRNNLRQLLQARESLKIQARAVELARRRVTSTDLFLQAGRAEVRDLLDAQEALLSAQNALTSAMVNYRVAELELQRDMGVLEVNERGLSTEFNPRGEDS